MTRNFRGKLIQLAATPFAFLVVPACVLIIPISLAVPALLLVRTFFDADGWNLSPWKNVYGDLGRWSTLLGNTGQATLTALAVTLLLGVPLGAVLFRADIRLRRTALAFLLLAAVVPFYSMGSTFLALFGVERLEKSALLLGVVHGLAYVPITALISGIAFRIVPGDLEDAAFVEGARGLGVFFRVTLRLAMSGILAALILVAQWVATDYSISDLIMVRTFAEEVYTQFALNARPEEPTLVCLPQAILFASVFWLLGRRFLGGGSATPSSTEARPFRSGRWCLPLSLVAVAACLCLAVAPSILMISRLEPSKGFFHYLVVFTPEIKTSGWTSFTAAAITAIIALGIAWFLVRRPRLRVFLAAYVVMLLALPGPLLRVGLIQLFNRPGPLGYVYDTPLMLILAYSIRFLPVAVILLVPAVRSIPVEYERAALTDGCTTFGVWRRIVVPLTFPALLVSTFVVTALSVGELSCSHLLSPAGYSTVASRFFSLIHYGLVGDAAALSLISILGVSMPWLALLLFFRKVRF